MGTVREEVAKNLLFYRKKAGLTQLELADKLGVKNTAVSNWEKGNNSVDIETLFRASQIFGVSLADMYGQYSSAPAPALAADEQQLVEDYRDASDEIRSAAATMLHTSAEQNRRDARSSSSAG